MSEFIDILLQKRWFLIAGMFIVVDLFLISLLASTAQAHHLGKSSQTSSSQHISFVPTSSYDSPNVVTNGLLMMLDDGAQAINTVEQAMLSSVGSVAVITSHGSKMIGHATYMGVTFTVRGIGNSFRFVAQGIGGSFVFTERAVEGGFAFIGRSIIGSFMFTGHTVGSIFSFFLHPSLSSVIRVTDHTPTPVITQLRTQQAALIESGTKDVWIPAISSGTGGACDNGSGNGGYPLRWCNAPMDTIATTFNNDPINRECTSYAYWYFTSVEGHTDFRAEGDAKYWAATSNYPTHPTPTDGAIAVETVGAYGHVAIVQALPGQTYAGQTVPAGYVLVSEMNYDWSGHFRYSYSPLSKFSTYIY